MSDYDSRRTGNGLLDTGSTPVWSSMIFYNQMGMEEQWKGYGRGYDRQYDGILQMIEMIVDVRKDLEEATRKIAELRREK